MRGDRKSTRKPARNAVETVDRFDVFHNFLKLGNRLNAPFSEHLERRYQVTMNEFRVVMMLGRLGAAASHELAEISGVTTMSISRAVASLQRKEWLACEIDPANRRRKILRLTKKGEALYRKMLPTAGKVSDYLFTGLTPDEVAAFNSYVMKLVDRLEARDEEGRSQFIEATRPEN